MQRYDDRGSRYDRGRELPDLTIEELLAELDEEYNTPLNDYSFSTSERDDDYSFRPSERDLEEDEFSQLHVAPLQISAAARTALGMDQGEDYYGEAPSYIREAHPHSPPSRNGNVWGVIAAAAILVVSLKPAQHLVHGGTPPPPGDASSLTLKGEDKGSSLVKPDAKTPEPREKPNPKDLSKLSYAEYATLIKEAGGKLHPNGIPSVLAIRYDRNITTKYSDLFIILTEDKNVVVLAGSTHPSMESHPKFMRDVNGDGLHDVGVLRPGNYIGIPNGPWAGYDSFHLVRYDSNGKVNGNLPGWRSTKRDKRLSKEEMKASERRGDTVSDILVHQGSSNNPRSLGCQTLSPDNIRRFVDAVGGASARFTFTLIDRPAQ